MRKDIRNGNDTRMHVVRKPRALQVVDSRTSALRTVVSDHNSHGSYLNVRFVAPAHERGQASSLPRSLRASARANDNPQVSRRKWRDAHDITDSRREERDELKDS